MRDTTTTVPLETPRDFDVGSVEVRRQPFDLDGWRHDQRLTAVVGLFALAMFFLFAPYVVVFFVPDADLHLLRDLKKSPGAVNVVIFLVMCKMVGLGTIFSAMPFFFQSLFSDPARPAPPAEVVSQRPRSLSRQERDLLQHGHATVATVTQVRWPRIRVVWTDRGGTQRELTVKSHAPDALDPPSVGEKLHVLYDPLHPDEGVVPRILDVAFEEPDEVEDQRPSAVSQRPAVREPKEISAQLQPTLRPVPRALWRSIKRAVIRSRAQGIGAIALRNDVLEVPGGEIDLGRSFVVKVSAWLARPDTVELNITVRQDAAPGGPAVTFRVERPMTTVSAEVPLRRTDAPWMTTEEFDALWSSLRFYLALQGRSLDSQVGALEEASSSTIGTDRVARVMTK